MPMSDVNFDKNPSCQSWQVLNKNRVFVIRHEIHYKTMSFLFNSVLYFPHNDHMVKEEKGE